MSRRYRVNFRLFNQAHNSIEHEGIFCKEIFPADFPLENIRNGFWVDVDGSLVWERMLEPGDTFVMPGQILSIEIYQ